MSGEAEWNRDQSIGERAMLEHEKHLAKMEQENELLRAALRRVLPMAEAWFRREFDGLCDHEPGECTCDQ